MATNEILKFAGVDTGTNLLTQAEYEADVQRENGNQAGIARSKLVNKSLRQASTIAAGTAEFLADNQATDITDDMTASEVAACFQTVIDDALTASNVSYDNAASGLDADTVQDAIDEVADADGIMYTPEGTGAVATTVQDKLRESVSVKDFGAVGDGVTDDTTAIQAAITSGASEIVFPNGVYAITSLIGGSALSVSDLKISGSGTVLCGTAGIQLTGDNNTVEGIVVKRATKSTSSSMFYTNYGLGIYGNNNTVRDVEIYNMNGPGISVGGHNNTIDGVYCHDNIVGMISGSSTRNITIVNSRFVYNDVVSASGTDGILFSRTNIGATVSNCDISYNAEHGVYFQGQKGIFTNNRVKGNAADGLKFGSYDDGGYAYPEETLDLWVPGSPGVPGYNGVDGADGYGMKDIIISNNLIEDNDGGDGIYFQPSAKNVIIENNILKNNDIRFVYFNYTGGSVRLELHENISVRGNKVYGVTESNGSNPSSIINICATIGTLIENNEVEGSISNYAPSSGTAPFYSERIVSPIIKNNRCATIYLRRETKGIVESNTTENISASDNTDSNEILYNTITNAQPIDTARIVRYVGNKVTCDPTNNNPYFTSAIPFTFPPEFTNNTITHTGFTGSYLIDASYNVNAPTYGIFSNNRIFATASYRPIEIDGRYCTVEGNLVVGVDSSDIAINNQGENMLFVGNVVPFGLIYMRNGVGNVVVGNKASIGGTTTGNTIANNG